MYGPRKSSSAGIVAATTRRDRDAEPPQATSASGSSAAASACATEPQTVPRLRVTVCPTWGSTAAKARVGEQS